MFNDTTTDQDTAEDEAILNAEDTEEVEEGAPESGNDSADEALREEADTAEVDDEAHSTTDNVDSESEESPEGEDAKAPPSDDDPEVIRKRYKDLQAEFTRRNQERKEEQQRFQEMQQRYEEMVRSQEQQSLPPWRPEHPAHGQFQEALSKYEVFREQMGQAQSEEERSSIADRWRPYFQQEDLDAIRAFEAHQREEQRRIVSDPSYLRQQYAEEARAAARAEYEAQRQVDHYRQFFSREDVKPLATKYGDILLSMLKDGVDAEKAVNRIRAIEADNAKALAESDRKAAQAEAQRKLAKGKAAATRDREGAVKQDPLDQARELCKQWGVPADGRNLAEALMQVNAS